MLGDGSYRKRCGTLTFEGLKIALPHVLKSLIGG